MMSRWLLTGIVILAVIVALPLAARLMRPREGLRREAKVGVTTPLHEAASGGHMGTVGDMLKAGADVNARDEQGRTPLHLAAEHGHEGTSQVLLQGGADPTIVDTQGKTAIDYALRNGKTAVVDILPASTATERAQQRLNPSLKYPDEASFAAAIGQPACLLKSDHVYLFAPKTREEGAKIVLPYLVKAYDELYRIVGVHTDYIIVVYNFSKGHSDAFGGTSNCTLWYGDENLDLEQHEEWTRYKIPHVSGYIEEMAHNFVAATRSQFGWEMVGWSIGVKASAKVAGNPILAQAVESTRKGQAETFRRYKELGCVFPPDLLANQVDRIHAYILWECEQQYGPSFWPDYFKELKKDRQRLVEASRGEGRDKRYQISLDCFDRLPGLNFKQRLKQNQISLTTDVKSLNPEAPTWNRKLQ